MKLEQKILAGFSILAIIVILAGLYGIIPRATAATLNQTNVTVEVGTVTQITVFPNIINWTSVNPGSAGGMKYLDIRNTGSTNITSVYGYADTITTEPNNPIPLGSSSGYSSGGVLMLRLNETAAPYYYADRLEWNITKPTGAASTGVCANAVSWGYYRNGSSGAANYLWCLTNGSLVNATNGCNETGTTLYIETDGDNGDSGTRDPDIAAANLATAQDWGILDFGSGPLDGHCVAAYRDCTKIMIYKYDRRTSPNFAACNADAALRSVTLTPSDQFTINLDAWVPQGMPAGWLAPSWLTIEAGS